VSENMSGTKNANLHALVESGLFIAVAYLLSYIKLFTMPQGGSVTLLSMLPLLLIGLRWGPQWGIGAGLIYGVLQYLQDGYSLTPFNLILDYVLAFGVLGIAGFFRHGRYRLYAATVTAVILRFICHFLSGILFYASYAPEGQAVWLYSLIYNGPFLAVEMISVMIGGGILLNLVPQLKPLKNP